jgi:hypothetical protein
MMWIVKEDVGEFSAIHIRNEKCKCRPKGNKENKNQPIGDKEKNCLECGFNISNVYCHLLSTFMIEVAILNGFGIKRLRILHTFGNLKGHLIIFLIVSA